MITPPASRRRGLPPGVEEAERDELLARAPELSAILTANEWADLTLRVSRQGPPPAAWAWRAGVAAHQHGRLNAALEAFRAADRDAAQPADLARLAAGEAATRWLRGEVEQVRRLATLAMTLAEESGDAAALASAWTTRALAAAADADREAILTAAENALRHAESAGDLLTLVRVHANLAARDLDEGRYDDALERAQSAIALQEQTGHVPSLARLREHLAQALLGLGRLDEALLEVETARALWSSVNAPARERAGLILGEVQATRGNIRQAQIAFQEAVRMCEAEHDHSSLPRALVGLAKTLAVLDPAGAADMVARALAMETATGHLPALLGAGWVHLTTGDRARAADLAAEAAALAARRQDFAGLAEGLELTALADGRGAGDAGLLEAGSIWQMLHSPVRAAVNELVVARLGHEALGERIARDRLLAAGIHEDAGGMAGPLNAVLSTDAAAVRVHVLGTFIVFRAGSAVPPGAWPSKKARDLLKILAGRRHVQRDILIDQLWGDQGTGAKLSVALSHLRAVLDPAHVHSADHFVVADRATVRLHPEHVIVDAVEFRSAASRALSATGPEAVPLLQAAAAMYTGEFAADDPYEDWAVQPREEIEALGGEVTRALAHAIATGPQPALAVPWLSRLLSDDPYDEPTYRVLIRLLVDEKRHGAARAMHRTYQLRMDELGVPSATWAELTG